MTQALTIEDADRILDVVVHFPEINASFERLRPITNFRKDDSEARILYLCRRTTSNDSNADSGEKDGNDIFVLKCKVQ